MAEGYNLSEEAVSYLMLPVNLHLGGSLHHIWRALCGCSCIKSVTLLGPNGFPGAEYGDLRHLERCFSPAPSYAGFDERASS